MLNGKAMLILLIVRLIKNTLYEKSQCFPKPSRNFGGIINVKVDLSNCAKKIRFKKCKRS